MTRAPRAGGETTRPVKLGLRSRVARVGRRTWNDHLRFRLPRLLRVAMPGLFFSASEFGEDKVLLDALREIPDRYYIDIGCWDPYAASDTYLLYRQGWSGLVIDANPRFAKAYKRLRPRDTFSDALVTGDGRDVVFVDSNGTSSASAEWQGLYPGRADARRSIRIQDLLDDLVPAGTGVGLLKIDVENLDAEILLAIDLPRLNPFVIMVELHVLWADDLERHGVIAHMRDFGYRVIGHNRRNVILVHERRFLAARPELAKVYDAAARAGNSALASFSQRTS